MRANSIFTSPAFDSSRPMRLFYFSLLALLNGSMTGGPRCVWGRQIRPQNHLVYVADFGLFGGVKAPCGENLTQSPFFPIVSQSPSPVSFRAASTHKRICAHPSYTAEDKEVVKNDDGEAASPAGPVDSEPVDFFFMGMPLLFL